MSLVGNLSAVLYNIRVEFYLYTKLVRPFVMSSVHGILCGHIKYIYSLRSETTFNGGSCNITLTCAFQHIVCTIIFIDST